MFRDKSLHDFSFAFCRWFHNEVLLSLCSKHRIVMLRLRRGFFLENRSKKSSCMFDMRPETLTKKHNYVFLSASIFNYQSSIINLRIFFIFNHGRLQIVDCRFYHSFIFLFIERTSRIREHASRSYYSFSGFHELFL